MTKEFRKRVVDWIERCEHGVDAVLSVLSIAAIALVVSSEFVPSTWTFPYFGWSWSSVQLILRVIIWSAYVSSFGIYSIISGQPFRYARNHLLELFICLTWIPQYIEGPFTVLNNVFVLSRFVPLNMLQLLGTLAHAWRVLRWTVERFTAHPLYVVSAAASLLVFSSAALLNHVEPETFKTFWDGAWFTLVTITTIGYGDLSPKTHTGRLITAFVIVGGISLFAVVIGLVSEFVRVKLLKQESNPEVAALRGKVRRLITQMEETRELAERLETQNAEITQLLRTLVQQRKQADAEVADTIDGANTAASSSKKNDTIADSAKAGGGDKEK